ncbi:MAG TPA: FAD:protein FMN transferase [Sneathiellales bacterium]|nr:FAD:protein FMN transferase [Sneathiellales bacterium]
MTKTPIKSDLISRRRMLRIVGATSAFVALPGTTLAVTALPVIWRGRALGANASITLYHPNRNAAAQIVKACVKEVRRLESIFSIFDPGSALSELNQLGFLVDPPAELGALLTQSRNVGDITHGAFDVTVQPLWRLFVDHFSQLSADPEGPPATAVDRTRRLVNYSAISVSARQINLLKKGMAITLNGIAQGFITDRVTDMLKAGGVDQVLVNMGELRGLGRHPDGRPWRVGLTNPLSTDKFSQIINVDNRAVASSGGYGTRFGGDGRFHHLFDPNSGSSANFHAGVTVVAPTATLADALSTGFSAMPLDGVRAVVVELDQVSAIVTADDGSVTNI